MKIGCCILLYLHFPCYNCSHRNMAEQLITLLADILFFSFFLIHHHFHHFHHFFFTSSITSFSLLPSLFSLLPLLVGRQRMFGVT